MAPISTGHGEGTDPKGDNVNIKGVGALIERYSANIEGSDDTTDEEVTGVERDGAEIARAA
jgi:hypothetical protein